MGKTLKDRCKLCRGLFPGKLPRGVGLDVAGVVTEIGTGVSDVEVGSRVLGTADYAGAASAGAANYAILNNWAKAPAQLDMIEAASLPMAVETAYRSLDNLGVTANSTLLVHGSGTVIGFAAVQMGLMRGARVITTAGKTYAELLRQLGAEVTP